MTTGAATPARAEPLAGSRTLADRFLAALPLLSVFVVLAFVYAAEAWSHTTPWLFTDELELTQLSRSFAQTGHILARGEPASFRSLYVFLAAPAWLFHNPEQAYAAVKYIGVFTMSAVVVPAYFLARLVASRRASLFAAAAAGAIPALVYSSYILEDTLAYPWAALSFLVITKALLTPSRWWIATAVVVSALAPLVKGSLVPIPLTLVLAAVLAAFTSERGRRWRSGWRAGDWTAVAFLVIGIGILAGGIASQVSFQYLEPTRYHQDLVLRHALKAFGALTIGVGLLPVVVAVGTLVRAPGERPSEAMRVFRCVLISAVLLFGLYAGVKGAYNQLHFGTRIWERNVTYVAPLFFVATAAWLDRRRLNRWSLATGAGIALFLLLWTPYKVNGAFAVDAPGLQILQQANLSLSWNTTDAKIALAVALALMVAAVLALQLTRPPRAVVAGIVGLVCVVLLAWNLTGEISASDETATASISNRSNIRGHPDWIHRIAGNARVVYIGHNMDTGNATSEWLLEFWNPGVQEVWSLDGTAPGPGRRQTPDLANTGGVLIGKPPSEATYAVVDPGIDVLGIYRGRHSHRLGGGFAPWRLYRITPPLRLLDGTTGITGDGWTTTDPIPGDANYGGPVPATFTRFGRGRGTIKIRVAQCLSASCHVTIRMGTLAIGADHQPRIGETVIVRHLTLHHSYESRTVTLPTPGDRFRVETIALPLVTLGDGRQVGAQVAYTFTRRKAAQR
jgi:hypothetical protein